MAGVSKVHQRAARLCASPHPTRLPRSHLQQRHVHKGKPRGCWDDCPEPVDCARGVGRRRLRAVRQGRSFVWLGRHATGNVRLPVLRLARLGWRLAFVRSRHEAGAKPARWCGASRPPGPAALPRRTLTTAVAELPQRRVCHVEHHLRRAGVALPPRAAAQLGLDAAALLQGRAQH
jgi:hypothetical protein